MSTHADISKAIDIFKKAGCPFELMHTVSTYPMRDEDANLLTIPSLRDKYSCDIGYSGHEVGLAVSYAAAALGISSLERHITLDRAMYGSDQSASIEPSGLRQLVGGVRKLNWPWEMATKGLSLMKYLSQKNCVHILILQPIINLFFVLSLICLRLQYSMMYCQTKLRYLGPCTKLINFHGSLKASRS